MVLKDLRVLAERSRRAHEESLRAASERNRAFLDAWERGASIRDIARAAGVSHVVVQTGINAARKARRESEPNLQAHDKRVAYEVAVEAARKIANRGVENPDAVKRLLDASERHTSGRARQWLEVWNRLLAAPDEEVVETLLAHGDQGADLRSVTPFVAVLQDSERQRALQRAR